MVHCYGDLPSTASHVEPGANLRGPPRKAKYSLATDSEEVARAKNEKNPGRGVKQNLKPYTYKRSEPYVGSLLPKRVTAYLLHNEPAS